MVRYEDPLLKEFLDDREVAEVVVRETWEMGEFVKPERKKLREVLNEMRATATRRGPERAKEARRRLKPVKPVGSRALPEAVIECFEGTHDRTIVTRSEDGFYLEFNDCPLCEKLWEKRRAHRLRKEKEGELEDLADFFSVLKQGLAIDHLFENIGVTDFRFRGGSSSRI